jgi:hypothetical protein
VLGASVGGRVWQALGLIVNAPKVFSVFNGISRCEIRAVTLFKAANTATLLSITSARLSATNTTTIAIYVITKEQKGRVHHLKALD